MAPYEVKSLICYGSHDGVHFGFHYNARCDAQTVSGNPKIGKSKIGKSKNIMLPLHLLPRFCDFAWYCSVFNATPRQLCC